MSSLLPNDIKFEITSSDLPLCQTLLGEFIAEITRYFGVEFDVSKGPSATAADFSAANGGCFLVLYVGSTAAGIGGVKKLDDETGEIKRMYLVPEFRGKGLGRRLLTELENQAKILGYKKVRLDTGGVKEQEGARALYNTNGYREIPDYNQNPYAAFWYEKDLL